MNYTNLLSVLFVCSSAFALAADSAGDRVGKTHFVVGVPATVAAPIEPVALPVAKSAEKKESTCALFAPDDNVRDALVKIIDDEKEAVAAAVFMVTDKAIAQALVRAKKRGVDVQLIVDVGCLKDKASKIPLLSGHGCMIYLYDPTIGAPNKTNSLMHHKFALFKNNKGTPVVWTGSYIFTKAASESNRENVMIIKKRRLYDQYLKQFEQLKNTSYRYERRTVIN